MIDENKWLIKTYNKDFLTWLIENGLQTIARRLVALVASVVAIHYVSPTHYIYGYIKVKKSIKL